VHPVQHVEESCLAPDVRVTTISTDDWGQFSHHSRIVIKCGLERGMFASMMPPSVGALSPTGIIGHVGGAARSSNGRAV
jgi:hypothetical protein